MWAIAGLSMVAASLICAIGAIAFVASRVAAVRRRSSALAARKAFSAIDGLRGDVDRIEAALREMRALETRAAAVASEILDAVGAGIALNADVRMVATSTQSLLETFVPSLRGSAAD